MPAGFFDQRAEDLPDPSASRAAQPLTSGVGRYGHTLSLQWLESIGVRLTGHLRSVEGSRLTFDDDLGESIRFADESSIAVIRRVEQGLIARGIAASLPPVEHDPADVPHPDPASVRSPETIDLDTSGIASVVWATGFGGRFDYLDPAWLDGRGVPRPDGVETPVPGLYVLGFPWLTCRGSGLIWGIDADATRLADALTRRDRGLSRRDRGPTTPRPAAAGPRRRWPSRRGVYRSETSITPRRIANLRSSTRSWNPSFSMMFAR